MNIHIWSILNMNLFLPLLITLSALIALVGMRTPTTQSQGIIHRFRRRTTRSRPNTLIRFAHCRTLTITDPLTEMAVTFPASISAHIHGRYAARILLPSKDYAMCQKRKGHGLSSVSPYPGNHYRYSTESIFNQSKAPALANV